MMGRSSRSAVLGSGVLTCLVLLPGFAPQPFAPKPEGQGGVRVKAFVAQGPAVFRARAAEEPHELNHYLRGSNACALQGDYPGAIDFMERGVRAVPDAPAHFHFNLGQLHARVGNFSAARQSFRTGLGCDPANPNYMEMLAVLEEDSGDLVLAERLYRAAHRYSSESNQRSFRLNRISLLLRAGRFIEAAALFRLVAAPAIPSQLAGSGGGVNQRGRGGGEEAGTEHTREQDWPYGNEFGRVECVHAYMSRWRELPQQSPASGGGPIYRKDTRGRGEGGRQREGGTVAGGEGQRGPGEREAAGEHDAIRRLRRRIAALQQPRDCLRARAVIMRMEHDEMGEAIACVVCSCASARVLVLVVLLVMGEAIACVVCSCASARVLVLVILLVMGEAIACVVCLFLEFMQCV
jgi:tetratricopeptide (TPR) repeat protein